MKLARGTVVVVAGTALAALERLPFRPDTRTVMVGHAALAAWFVWLAWGG